VSRHRKVGVVGWPQKTNVALVAAWRKRGIAVDLLEPQEALASLGRGDVAVTRLDVLPTLDGVQPGLDLIDELAANGVRVVNAGGPVLATHDKLITARLLDRAMIPTPRTEHIAGERLLLGIAPPLVVKPRFGSWGACVYRCDTVQELVCVLRDVQRSGWYRRHGAVVQELVPPLGHDLRLVVAGSRVVGAVERVARPGEWRTNVSLGGTRRKVVPSARACDLGLRAAAACGMDLVGIDLLPTDDGYVVLELNGAVEFDNSYDLPGSDIYQATADALALPRRALQTDGAPDATDRARSRSLTRRSAA
jgi:RimK family alpha-L-glutamate ligase